MRVLAWLVFHRAIMPGRHAGPLRHPRICTVQTPSGVHVGVAAAVSELNGLGLSSQCLFFAHPRACLQRASRPLSLSSRHRLELLKQPMWTPSWTRPSTRQLATFRCAEFFGDLPGSAAESNLVVQRCQAEASVVHGYQLRLECMQSFGEILKGLYGKGLQAADYASDVRPLPQLLEFCSVLCQAHGLMIMTSLSDSRSS